MSRLIRQEQLIQLILAHFREISREPAVFFWGIIFPILMSLGLGVAFTQKMDTVRNVAVIECSDQRSPHSDHSSKIEKFLQDRTERMESSDDEPVRYKITLKNEKLGDTTFLFQKTTWQTAMVLLKRGNLGVVMDENNGEIRYHFDPLNPDAQLTYLKLSAIFGSAESFESKDQANIETLAVSGTRYIDFLVPGLIAMGIMTSCMWGISYGIIEKRTKKLLRRMVATPMKKSHFLIAQTYRQNRNEFH